MSDVSKMDPLTVPQMGPADLMLWRNGAATRTMVEAGVRVLKAPIPDGAFKLSEDAKLALLAMFVYAAMVGAAPPECSCYDVTKAGGS